MFFLFGAVRRPIKNALLMLGTTESVTTMFGKTMTFAAPETDLPPLTGFPRNYTVGTYVDSVNAGPSCLVSTLHLPISTAESNTIEDNARAAYGDLHGGRGWAVQGAIDAALSRGLPFGFDFAGVPYSITLTGSARQAQTIRVFNARTDRQVLEYSFPVGSNYQVIAASVVENFILILGTFSTTVEEDVIHHADIRWYRTSGAEISVRVEPSRPGRIVQGQIAVAVGGPCAAVTYRTTAPTLADAQGYLLYTTDFGRTWRRVANNRSRNVAYLNRWIAIVSDGSDNVRLYYGFIGLDPDLDRGRVRFIDLLAAQPREQVAFAIQGTRMLSGSGSAAGRLLITTKKEAITPSQDVLLFFQGTRLVAQQFGATAGAVSRNGSRYLYRAAGTTEVSTRSWRF